MNQVTTNRVSLCLLVVSLALALPWSNAYGQVLYGSLTGSITDASQAAIPGATVQAQSVGTGVAREAITNDEGIFFFGDLQPGVYKLTMSSKGFASAERTGVTIEANRTRRVDARGRLR